jgi:hypothetical protein
MVVLRGKKITVQGLLEQKQETLSEKQTKEKGLGM